MNFDKHGFDAFRADMNEALKLVGMKHGVKIELGSINYNEYEFNMKLNVIKNDNNVNGEREKFAHDCGYYGFRPEHYNIEFLLNGKPFRLVGFNLNKPKNNCNIVSLIDGKKYMCNDEPIRNDLIRRNLLPSGLKLTGQS